MNNRKQWQKVLQIFSGVSLQKCLSSLMVVLLSLGATTVSAEEKSADQWQYDFQVYLWGTTIKANTVTDDSFTMNFGTILENLDMVLLTSFGARKNKFSMLADVVYLDVSDSQKHDGEFLGHPITGKLEVGLKSWVLNFIGGYNLIDNGKNQFDITAGARYLDVKVDTTFKLNDQKRKNSRGDHVWDGVIGIKGRHNYPDGYYFNYYADVGGGDSKLTWQALVNFAYDYKKFTGIVGYRYLTWDLGNGSKALDDLTIHGPYISAKWSF